MRPIVRKADSVQRPNWIEINLDAIANNIQIFRSRIPDGTRLLLPVKADAYGHGSLACSWAAIHSGIDWLGVAHLFEGVLLRQYGIPVPILILGTVVPEDFQLILDYALTPSFAEASTAMAFEHWLEQRNLSWKAHLKVDTGMHRFGILSTDSDTIRKLFSFKHLHFEGLFSHLATADVPGHSMTQVQLDRFAKLVQVLKDEGTCPPICHLANSAGVLNHPEACYDMVRPGIALYGYNPMGEIPGNWGLQPVMRMKASIRQIREVPTGESVSYGHLWTATRPTRVATVAIGYGDGYMRGEVNQGWMFVRGKACPILGRVCMDATMIDISEVPEACVGDMVDVIHGEVDARISLEAIASRCHTISYEIATRVARRLYRKYHWKGRILRWDELRMELGIPDYQDRPDIPAAFR